MKHRAIASVVIASSGHLFVAPELEGDEDYEYIYREADGLRWDRTSRSLHAHEPERWEHVELLLHIASALRSACDEDIHLTEKTVWQGVPVELQSKMRSALS